jgi:D-tyrosyl-tRNA(Tyr) deacylase
MKAVLQRVLEAKVLVDRETVGHIGPGLLLYLGVQDGDTNDDLISLAEKVLKLRIFPDSEERMNFPITEVAGAILVVSQFTLCADVRKGNRPSFSAAARPEEAHEMYMEFVRYLSERGVPVQTGLFGAHMEVSSINDGPVTLWLDSRENLG